MTRSSLLLLALLATLAPLSACGFQPMYGTHSAAPGLHGDTPEGAFGEIAIANIPDREGVYLRNALIDRFYSGGYPSAPRYDLKFGELGETLTNLDITTSSEATRAQLQQFTVMTLVDRATGEALLTRNLRTVTSYNILESEFATRVSQQAARESGLDDLARQAELQISLFLNRAPDGKSAAAQP